MLELFLDEQFIHLLRASVPNLWAHCRFPGTVWFLDPLQQRYGGVYTLAHCTHLWEGRFTVYIPKNTNMHVSLFMWLQASGMQLFMYCTQETFVA